MSSFLWTRCYVTHVTAKRDRGHSIFLNSSVVRHCWVLGSVQDDDAHPVEPTLTLTFSVWGITDFSAQYWDGSNWITVPNGTVSGNNKVWRQFTFSNVTTDRIRILVTGALWSNSRITEVEAYTSGG